MRGRILAAALAAVALAAVWSFATSAQVDAESPCERACYEQESLCVSACGERSDPMDCEERCQEQRDDCLEQCR